MIETGSPVVSEPSGTLRLREVGSTDAENLYRWRMEPSARAMFRDAEELSLVSHRAFIASYFRCECTDHWFVIEVEGRPVGTIALHDFSADRTEAEWGRFVIAPEYRGQGWGRRALRLLLDYSRAIGVRRLRCEVLASNSTAASLYRSLGFADDGSYELGGRRFQRLVANL